MTIEPCPRWRALAITAALLLCARTAAADEALAWLPLTAAGWGVRAEIAAATRGTPIGYYLHDPTQVELAFAEIDEHPGDEPSERQPEIWLRLAAGCSIYDCLLSILTWDGDSYAPLTSLYGADVALASGFSHGRRDLVVDGDPFWFDGRNYVFTGSIEGWRVLTDLDPVDRVWIEEELGIGIELLPEPNPLVADDVYVAFVELDQPPPSPPSPSQLEVVVIDRNGQSCGRIGCLISVYTNGPEGHRRIGDFIGWDLSLGSTVAHGMRSLILDGRGLFVFDGVRYDWVGRLPAATPR